MTVLAALVALTMVDSVDIPAARGTVLAWAVAWFVLGYALYATVFGALGALASRPEDTQSAAGPVTVILVAGYFVSFAAIGSPDTVWAKVVSFVPATAPLAMPNRIAMGAAAWWEPLLAAALTLAAIAGLVVFGGRVYSGGILHSGPTLTLRAAWRGAATAAGPGMSATGDPRPTRPQTPKPITEVGSSTRGSAARLTTGAVVGVAAALGAAVAAMASDVILGVAAGAGFYAIAARIVKARADRGDIQPSHRKRPARPPL